MRRFGSSFHAALGMGFALAVMACGQVAPLGVEEPADGGASMDAAPSIDAEPPPIGRPTATVCAPSPPPTTFLPDGGSGPCAIDSDCSIFPSTITGRCVSNPDGGPNQCDFDQCLEDSDCGKLGPCSPTVTSGCGPYVGVAGYYCHTAIDECATNSDCGNDGSAEAPYCAFDISVNHWICGTQLCSG